MSHPNPLEKILLSFSPYDHFTALDACESILITGAPGSGKTSTIGRMLMLAMLLAGFGFLILCCKPDEASRVIEVVTEARREDDIVLFNAESGAAFDPFYYEFNRPGRGQHDAESVIDFMNAIISFGKPPGGSSGDSQFFEKASDQASRHAIALIRLAGQPVSITEMYRVITSLPKDGELESAEWQLRSRTAELLNLCRERQDSMTPDERSDLDACVEFLCVTWPSTDPRTTSNILMTWKASADKFQFQPLKRLFSEGRCTFLPEHATQSGKIIIADFPLNEYGIDTGRLISGMIKLAFQRAWLRRDVKKHPTPVVLFEDEAQNFLAPPSGGASRENAFLQVSRSARVSTVFMTQSISNIAEALGEHSIGAHTKALLGNFGTRISFQSNDTDSNKLFADLIGKEWRPIRTTHYGNQDMSHGSKPELVYIVEPHEFTRLQKPDTRHPTATAVVYCGGRTFNITKTEEQPEGRNFLLAEFSR